MSDRFRAMGCDTEVVVVGGTAHHLGLARRLIADLEQCWSRFIPTSDISRINAAGGADVVVDPSTITLVTAMVQAWVATDGAFDPTLLAPLVELGYVASWDDPAHITRLAPGAARRSVPTEVLIDPSARVVRAPAGTTLDPGGIGKGLAADLVTSALLATGARGALVGIGGDVRVSGAAPNDAVGWRIGVVDVLTDREDEQVLLAEGGVATSGTQHRTWRRPDGSIVHHLLDPASGRPVASGRQAAVEATVVAGTAAWAEVFTKALLVCRPQHVLADLDRRGLAARVRDASGRVFHNQSWERLGAPRPSEVAS
jgi:thiamine biosynthesis lipoprotein